MTLSHHPDIEVMAGDSWEIDATLQDVNGNPVNLAGATLMWAFIDPDGFQNTPIMAAAAIVVASDPTTGQLSVMIPAGVTEMPPGRCWDALRLIGANGITDMQWIGQIVVDADPFAQIMPPQPGIVSLGASNLQPAPPIVH